MYCCVIIVGSNETNIYHPISVCISDISSGHALGIAIKKAEEEISKKTGGKWIKEENFNSWRNFKTKEYIKIFTDIECLAHISP